MSESAARDMRNQAPAIDLEEFERRLRAPEPARRNDDPLAELARLLGSSSNDPFRGLAPPSADGVPQQAAHYEQPQLAQQPGDSAEMHPEYAPQALRHVAEQMRHAAGDYPAQTYAAQDASQHQPADHWQEQPITHAAPPEGAAYQDEWAEPAQAVRPTMPLPPQMDARADGDRRALSRKSVLYMGSALAVVVVGIGATLATSGKMKSGAAPTISASKEPVKVKPEIETASAVRPVRNVSILDKTVGTKPGQGNVVSREEQPVDLTQVQGQPRGGQRVPESEINRIVNLNNRDIGKPVASVPSPTTSAPQAAGYFPEPRKVRTVAVRPDGSVVVAPPPAPSIPALAAGTPAVRPAAATPAAVPAPRAAAPVKATTRAGRAPTVSELARNGGEEPDAAPVATTRPPARPAPRTAPEKPKPAAQPQRVAAAQPAPAPRATPAPAASGGGGFAVQLAAPPTEAEANSTAARLRQRFGSELGGRAPSVRAATVGAKTVYRVRIGGLSREDATSLCSKLQGKGGACFVARN